MSDADSLGNRMKAYEQAYKITLPRRMPVIIRVDGKAFHTLTRGCKKPFDDGLMDVMDETAKALCEEIQGAQLAYVQSDEISVLVHGYKTINSQPWFNNELQKMVSVSASAAAAAFNTVCGVRWCYREYVGATFDSRVFILPEDEVCNYFIWRQQDATRNSIQMVARANFSHKECDGLDCNELQEKLWKEKQINWNDLATKYRRGRCAYRSEFYVANRQELDGKPAIRHSWEIDNEIPLFTASRAYIDSHVYIHHLDQKTVDERWKGVEG